MPTCLDVNFFFILSSRAVHLLDVDVMCKSSRSFLPSENRIMELSDDSQSGFDGNSEGVAALIESMSSEMSSGIETVLSDLNLMSEDIIVHRNWVQNMIVRGEKKMSTSETNEFFV